MSKFKISKFKISSALKDIIGRELITNDFVAIFELVKNSYDANARNVKIIFENVKGEGNSKIFIFDDGFGMSNKDITNKWLFLGYSEKKISEEELEKLRNKGKRVVAGSKGIGRFSCDRLGSKLTVRTRKRLEKNYNVLNVNWNNFEESQNKEFQEINVDLDESEIEHPKFSSNSGTLLEIQELNESWDVKKLQILKRHLQSLINPNQLNDKDSFNIVIEAKEFKDDDDKEKRGELYIINGRVINTLYEKLKLKTTVLDVEISKNGEKIKTKLADKGIFIFEYREDKSNKYQFLKNIKIKISFLNQSAKGQFKRIMNLDLKEYGSIFVFKNGVRIFPYGDREDDWLRLEARKGQGYARNLGLRELVGKVEINGLQNELREVSSRSEGLVRTKTFEQLKEFMVEKVVKILEKYVVGVIDWDSGRKGKKKTDSSINIDLIYLLEKITGGNIDSKNLKYNPNLLNIFQKKIDKKEIFEYMEDIEKLILTEKKTHKRTFLLKKLSQLKKNIPEAIKRESEAKIEIAVKSFKQEASQTKRENLYLKSIQSREMEDVVRLFHYIYISSDVIRTDCTNLINSSIYPKLCEKLGKLIKHSTRVLHLSQIGMKGGISEAMEKSLKNIFQFIFEFIENICKPYHNNIEININEFFESKLKKNFSAFELTYLIENLISNSKKANAKKINFILKENNDFLTIAVIDDGVGLNRGIKNIEDIFKKNFTTTLGGAGLGLYDAREFLKELNGTIIGENLKNGFKIIIKIPK